MSKKQYVVAYYNIFSSKLTLSVQVSKIPYVKKLEHTEILLYPTVILIFCLVVCTFENNGYHQNFYCVVYVRLF